MSLTDSAPRRPDTRNVSITLSGHHTGQSLGAVVRVLRRAGDIELCNVAQYVVGDSFTATAVLSSNTRTQGKETDVVKEILFGAHEEDLEVEFGVLAGSADTGLQGSAVRERCSEPPCPYGVERFVVTLITPERVPARLLAEVSKCLSEKNANIEGIDRLSNDGGDYMCYELTFQVDNDESVLAHLRKELFELGRKEKNADIALQKANLSLGVKRIVLFDLSWTLVQCDAVDILLTASNTKLPKDVVSKRAKGELTDVEWLRERCRALKGVRASSAIQAAAAQLKYTKGAMELCKGLKRLGYRTAVVSSGSKLVADIAKRALGLDFAYGNVFHVDRDGCFTGSIKEPIIDSERKADLVQMLAMQERLDPEQMICVGDGPASCKMLSMAGLSIAFDQPDASAENVGGRISSKSLAPVLYLLGVSERDFHHVVR